MAVQFSGNFMAYELDGEVVATARFRQHAAADGQGAWIVMRFRCPSVARAGPFWRAGGLVRRNWVGRPS
jgi:hypothetical protein